MVAQIHWAISSPHECGLTGVCFWQWGGLDGPEELGLQHFDPLHLEALGEC